MRLFRKLAGFCAILFLFPLLTFAQGYQYSDKFEKQGTTGLVAYNGFASVCTASGLTTTAATITSNVATLTMSSNPITAGFVNGRNILLINFTGSDVFFNSTFTLTNVTTTTLQFSITHANWNATSNGGAIMYPSAGNPCAPQASIFSNQALTAAITQPATGDANGNFSFFATPGSYWLGESASSGATPALFYVTLPLTADAAITVNVDTGTVKQTTPSTGKYLRDNGTKFVSSSVAAAGAGTCTNQFPRTLNDNAIPTCASVSLSADVTGTLPNSNLNTQGTDTNLLTAGTVSASTGVALCTDANHGATTSGCTPGGVTEMALTANGQTSLTIVCQEGASGSNLCAETVFANAHTLVRLTYNLSQAPATCSPNAVIAVRDVTAGSNLTTITVNQGVAGFVDSGALSIATTAGHKILVGTNTAAAGCGTVPNANTISAVFQ